jgi:hypothetical protein
MEGGGAAAAGSESGQDSFKRIIEGFIAGSILDTHKLRY